MDLLLLRHKALMAVSIALAAGCASRATGPAVRYVKTDTAGVIYVVVRPVAGLAGPKPIGKAKGEPGFAGESEYILRCDGRGADGMDCHVVTEISRPGDRLSPAPTPSVPPAAIKSEVGGLQRATVEVQDAVPSPTPLRTGSPPPPDDGKEEP